MPYPRSAPGRSAAIVGAFCFIALFASACGARDSTAGAGASAATHTPTVDCASINGDPVSLTIPLPPNTVSHTIGGGAAGATYYIECTPHVTQSQLVASLNAGFQQAGWTRWDPAVDDSGGCGGQANDFWQWKNGQVAAGWTFHGAPLPEWTVAVCSLAYATPLA